MWFFSAAPESNIASSVLYENLRDKFVRAYVNKPTQYYKLSVWVHTIQEFYQRNSPRKTVHIVLCDQVKPN